MKPCLWCKKMFPPARKTSRFCSKTCTHAEWRSKNLEHVRAVKRDWQKTHREHCNNRQRSYFANQHAPPGEYTPTAGTARKKEEELFLYREETDQPCDAFNELEVFYMGEGLWRNAPSWANEAE